MLRDAGTIRTCLSYLVTPLYRQGELSLQVESTMSAAPAKTSQDAPIAKSSDVAKRELFRFFVLTLAVQYTACFAVILFSRQIAGFFSQKLHQDVDPSLLLFVGAYSPTLVGVCLALFGRRGSFRCLLRSLLRWRVGFTWWAITLLTIPLVNLLLDLVLRGLGFVHTPLNIARYTHTLPLLLIQGYIFDDTGPLGEEIGWRGYALPRLLSFLPPLHATLVVGTIWAVWHVPAWFLPGLGFAGTNFLVFIAYCLAMSTLMTHTYIHAKQSALLGGIMWHLISNATYAADIGKSYLRSAILMSVCAALVLWLDRRRMFKKPEM